MQPTLGIVGNGIVGKSVAHGFRHVAERVMVHDKYQASSTLKEVVEGSRFIFLCVPTPCDFKRSRIDLSILDDVVASVAALEPRGSFVVIKSTVTPGTTDAYREQFPKLSLAMVPEFLREARYLEDAENPDRIVVGCASEDTGQELETLYRKAFPETPLFRVSPTEAELIKYMSNCFLAAKVIFGNLFYEYASEIGADYETLKKVLTNDHRITDDHLDVTEEGGFGGKCLPKDLNSLVGFAEQCGLDTGLLREIWRKNIAVRKVHDWEKIPGASWLGAAYEPDGEGESS